jgi:outer membrane receptor protein involved in Fe transport
VLPVLPADAATGLPQTRYETIKPEKVHHFEIGLKSQFWDRKATLNLAAFRTVHGIGYIFDPQGVSQEGR